MEMILRDCHALHVLPGTIAKLELHTLELFQESREMFTSAQQDTTVWMDPQPQPPAQWENFKTRLGKPHAKSVL